jgi:hypothetical protein
MALYKPGDVVCIIPERNHLFNTDGEMDEWLNRYMTIRHASSDADAVYTMEEDGGRWAWDDSMISGLIHKPLYAVGDVVRIVSERTTHFDEDGDMDEWLEQDMTIRSVDRDIFYEDWNYKMAEDEGRWTWDEEMIVGFSHNFNIEDTLPSTAVSSDELRSFLFQ